MSLVIDYYLTPVSPWAYIGSARFAEMAARHAATVRVKPVNFATVLGATGGVTLAKRSDQRKAYRMMELKRWRRRLGLTFNLEPRFFPANDELAGCMILACEAAGGDALALANALGRACWEEERNLTDAATLQAVAKEQGQDGEALLAQAQDPAMVTQRDALSDEAIAAGVFGAPSYVVAGEVFWGQDRLDFLEEALAGSAKT